jgi:hypothetical protein
MLKIVMREHIQAAQAWLALAQGQDGGWPYRAGMQSYPEPTCYSLLALAPEGWPLAAEGLGDQQAARQRRALDWLVSRVNSHGALTLDGDDEPHWGTSLFVLTLSRLKPALPILDLGLPILDSGTKEEQSAIRNPQSAITTYVQRSVQWLLSWQGNTLEPETGITVNSRLRGWPWMSHTFSWVEPTCYAVLALKLWGLGRHPRVAEAERLLLDRACSGGGWNYGGRIAFGRDLQPYLPTTALAIVALQDAAAASQAIERGVATLRTGCSQHQSALGLALTILCFQATGQPTNGLVAALLNRQTADGSWDEAVHLTALAALSLQSVTGGLNVFKL